MPLSFPYTACPGYVFSSLPLHPLVVILTASSVGSPVPFYVGPNPSTRFDVHHFLLSKLSPLFTLSNRLPRIVNKGIELPNTEPAIFHALFLWLYERQPPVYTSASDLLTLCKLWVLAGQLGIWKTQNTVLRLGMELMQPKTFVCELETVRWVYANTPQGAPLLGYVITIFCQRGPPATPAHFSPVYEKLGIFRDAALFMRVLSKVRAGNPKGVDGYDLTQEFPLEYTFMPIPDEFGVGQVRGTLVTGGKEVDWSRIEYLLPSFLVWGENWEVLPDMHFVTEERAVHNAKYVGRQIGIRRRGGRWERDGQDG
jgi:hypothetical protein